MSGQVSHRVEQLLVEAESVLDEASEELSPLSRTATEIVETTEAHTLLDAVGFAEASTVPEAITTGNPAAVADLRALLAVTRVPQPEDEGYEEAVQVVRERMADRRESSATEAEAEDTADDSRPDDSSAAEVGGVDEASAEAEGNAVETGAEDEASTDDSGVTGALRTAMRDMLESFGDDLTAVQEQLADLEQDEAADGETVTDAADKVTDEQTTTDEAKTHDESRHSTRHSTVAVSPSDRADMGTKTRHSTVSGRGRFSTMPELG